MLLHIGIGITYIIVQEILIWDLGMQNEKYIILL